MARVTLNDNPFEKPRYIIIATNAGGANWQNIGVYDDAAEAIKEAKRLGKKAMTSIFGPKDYRNGEIWTVDVAVAVDEAGRTYGEGERPSIYVKDIPTR